MKRRRNREAVPQRRHTFVELYATHVQGQNVRRELRNRWKDKLSDPQEIAAFVKLQEIYNHTEVL